MLIDTLLGRLVRRFRHSKNPQYNESSLASDQRKIDLRKQNPKQPELSLFKNARNLTVNNPTFIEHRSEIIHNFVAGNLEVDPALGHIATHADLDAIMDSSARYPPPLCHPGTRLKVRDKLFNWLTNPDRDWNMIWLHGSAGIGKSAVAQTLAEHCEKNGNLGACFFFSRLKDRSDPNAIVPTLVYQLAVRNPAYKSFVANQLANDPELLRKKSRHTQFKKLIIEPLSALQVQGHQSVQEPLLIILDGLDECEGEDAQEDIIEMISEVVRLKKELPLAWLICSRPEAHLKCIFSRADFNVNCGREELLIDTESISDVNIYLRGGFAKIKAKFPDLTTPKWPSEEQIMRLSNKASGHFGFASTSLQYIGDPTSAAPITQLDTLLSFLRGVKTGTDILNPLEVLDALYTGILCGVPDEILPTTQLILGHSLSGFGSPLDSAQSICNFLHIDQVMFYKAFRKLHSVVNVPSPETAPERRLMFHHLSFKDYLRDSSRSGKFAIKRENTLLQYSKLYLSWYKTDLELFHTTDGPVFNFQHDHGALPDLKWISDDNIKVPRSVARHAEVWCWLACRDVVKWDTALLAQIQNFDFRYIRRDFLGDDWCGFINKLWENTLDGFIRTEAQGEVDLRLLEYMEYMIKSWWGTRAATFPLNLRKDGHGGEYFLLGHDVKAIVCWTTGLTFPKPSFGALNSDKAPSEEQISNYSVWLAENGAVRGDMSRTGEGGTE